MSEIFVIGAGPAGLAAAYGLSKQGRKSHYYRSRQTRLAAFPEPLTTNSFVLILADTDFLRRSRIYSGFGKKYWAKIFCDVRVSRGSIITKSFLITL